VTRSPIPPGVLSGLVRLADHAHGVPDATWEALGAGVSRDVADAREWVYAVVRGRAPLSAARAMGMVRSEAKTAASRANGMARARLCVTCGCQARAHRSRRWECGCGKCMGYVRPE
jgi:hypothetical protein